MGKDLGWVSRERGRKLILFGLVLLVGVSGVIVFPCDAIGRYKLSLVERRVQELQQQKRLLRRLKPSLGAPQIPGNAWGHYERVLSRQISIPYKDKETELLFTFAYDRVKLSPAQLDRVDQALGRFFPALDDLRQGARSSYIETPDRFTPVHVTYLEYPIEGCIAAQARRWFQQDGKKEEAWALLADGLIFNHDLWIFKSDGIIPTGALEDYLGHAILAERPDAPTLRRLDGLLVTLEGMLPDLSLDADVLVANYGVSVQSRALPQLPHGRKASFYDLLGFLGSERWAAYNQFAWVDETAHAARVPDEEAWATALQMHAALKERRARSRNIYIREPYDEGGAPTDLTLKTRRTILAKLRLCRLLIHALLHEGEMELPDPFGTVLHTAREGAETRFWSVGPDGVDDGGVGVWDPVTIQKTGDIVLRLRHQ